MSEQRALSDRLNRWRYRGIDCLGPTATEILMLIIDGTSSVTQLSRIMGLSMSATTNHLRRLRGLGLIDWTYKRAESITPACTLVDVNMDAFGPIDSCDVESTEIG